MPSNAPDWRALFDTALAGLGPVKLATRLGYSNHTLVSRIGGGHIAASPVFQKRVIDRLFVVAECPATLQAQPRSECARIGAAFDFVLAEDLADHPGDYKLYIMQSCTKLTPSLLKTVSTRSAWTMA